MNILHTVVLGIVEGVTEFLPVSSTFHLIWTTKILGIPQTDFEKLFEVFIQSGAILSVVFLYFKTVIKNTQLLKKVAFAFVPTAVIGFLLYKVIKNVFFNSDVLMLSVFILVGLIFIIYEWYAKKSGDKFSKSLSSFTYKEAIIIGFIQSLAVLPGVSRAGAVMLGMMFMGFRRDESATFSFLLAVPTLLAASGYDLWKMRSVAFATSGNVSTLLIGTIVSFISAYFVVKWFIAFLQKHSLANFGWYRIAAGLLLVFFGIK